MPCYNTISISVSGEYKNQEAIIEALKEQGFGVVLDGETIKFRKYGVYGTVDKTGKLQATDNTGYFEQSKLQQSYSAKLVEIAAKKFNWQVQRKGNKLTIEKKGR